MATVSIIKATYSDPRIEALLAPIGGMEKFVKENEKVLLKVNLLSAKKGPEEVTYAKCIRCFCCHDVCPENAIVLRNVKFP